MSFALSSCIADPETTPVSQLTEQRASQHPDQSEHTGQGGGGRSSNKAFRIKSEYLVLYDGQCPLCVKEIWFLKFMQTNRPEKVDFIDISLPDYDGGKYKGVSYEMAMEEMHVIDENDKVHRGVPAFSVMYSATGLGWVGRFLMWSPVRPFAEICYEAFARNRLKWTGRGEECQTGRCEKKK